MDRSTKGLNRLIDEARRRLRRAAWLEGALVTASTAMVALLAGALLVLAGASIGAVAAVEAALLIGLGALLVVRYRKLLEGLVDPAHVARWVDDALRMAERRPKSVTLRSAVELERGVGEGASAELAALAIAEAERAAKAVDLGRLIQRSWWPSLRRHIVVAMALGVALGLLGVFQPGAMRTAGVALWTAGIQDNPLVAPPAEPRLGDIRITYRYPAYSGRSTMSVDSVSGDVRALPGTEVIIETRSLEPLSSATVLLGYGEGQEESETQRIAAEVSGRRIRATMVVNRSGRYRFSLRTTAGEVLEQRRGHRVELELDAPPTVKLTAPETSPLEVNEGDTVELAFSAEDDFGLGEVQVAWRVLGEPREGKQRLAVQSRGRRIFKGTAAFELAALELKPGDRVAYSVEALDNDTVGGPKVGASKTQELRVYSKDVHHREVLALQDKALDELVHILGDNLENAFTYVTDRPTYEKLVEVTHGVLDRARQANALLLEVVEEIRKDPLGQQPVAEAFETARQELRREATRKSRALFAAERALETMQSPSQSRTDQVRRSQDRMVEKLEKNVVYLADLLNDQRMMDAEALTKELREQQQRLQEALTDYRDAPSEEKRRLLQAAIEDIKARIREITQELSKLMGSIPQEYLNPDALETQQTQAGMERVQQLIEEGDLDGAMAELDRMLKGTEQMIANMRDGRSELKAREYSEVAELAQELQQELAALEAAQQSLRTTTEDMARDLQDEMKSRLGDPKAFIEKQLDRLAAAAKEMEKAAEGAHTAAGDPFDQTLRRMDDTGRALQAEDFSQAAEMAGMAQKMLRQLREETDRRARQVRRHGDLFDNGDRLERAARHLRRAEPKIDKVLEDLDNLMPNPNDLMSPEDRRRLDNLAKQQQALGERTQKMGEKLDKLGQELPIVGEGPKKMVEDAERAMGQAGRGMGEGDAPGALPHQRQALDALGELRQALEQMGDQGGGQGGGMPLPFGNRQPSGEGTEMGGQRHQNKQERVEIPRPEQFEAPAEFRQDILEAAKQGTVEAYKDAVQRYYEEIVK